MKLSRAIHFLSCMRLPLAGLLMAFTPLLSLPAAAAEAAQETVATDEIATLSHFEALFSHPADNDALERLSRRLGMDEALRGDFVQLRQLRVLKRPLRSHGHFIFARDKGLVWLQLSPFKTQLILSGAQLLQIDSQGNRQRQDAARGGVLAQSMPALVRAMLGGDIGALSAQFSLFLLQEGTLPGDHWQLGLVPKDPLLAKALAAIVMQGTDRLETLSLFNPTDAGDAKADRTRIDFGSLQPGPLDATETAALAQVTAQESPTAAPEHSQ
jgi:hypothetical protein